MYLAKNRERIHAEYQKLAQRFPQVFQEIKVKIGGLSQEVRLAMEYLYVSSPFSDVVNYDFQTYLDFATHGVMLWESYPRVRALPEGIYLNYVLSQRVNEEEILPCRSEFYQAISPALTAKGEKELGIEVNYWCAQEATYQAGDERTLPALTVYRRGYGRCGEESTFLVNALRSVGIPARQVYVPRWSHCDDNHAWTELYCEGRWYFTGACEPLMILNKGWFSNASSRAMVLHSRLFETFSGALEGEEVIGTEGRVTMLNQLARYAITRPLKVRVVDKKGMAVPDAMVAFQVLNYAEYFSAAEMKTDAQGEAVLKTGLGTLRVQASKDGLCTWVDVDVREQKDIVIELGRAEESAWIEQDVIPPLDAPVNPDMPTPAQKEEGERRLSQAVALRKSKKDNWTNPERETFLEGEGDKELRRALLDQLSWKDQTDCRCEVLEEHLQYGKIYQEVYPREIFLSYVLNPRVEHEVLRCYRKEILEHFTEDEKKRFCENPEEIWTALTTIREEPSLERSSLITVPTAVLRGGVGSHLSKSILFVAIARTLGIPARLKPENKEPEYWRDGSFAPAVAAEKKTSRLVLHTTGEEWKYLQNWTLGQEKEGTFVTLDLSSVAWSKDDCEVFLTAGKYRILTANRLPNGNLFTYEKVFMLKEGESREVTLVLRKAELCDMLEEILLPDFAVETETGEVLRTSDLTGEKERLLLWLEEGREPTEHILNEMLEQPEEFEKYTEKLRLMIRTPEAKKDPTLNRVLERLPNLCFCYDSFEENIELLGRRLYVDPGRLPLIVVTNGEGKAVYAASGYQVGIGDMLLRIMKEVWKEGNKR